MYLIELNCYIIDNILQMVLVAVNGTQRTIKYLFLAYLSALFALKGIQL